MRLGWESKAPRGAGKPGLRPSAARAPSSQPVPCNIHAGAAAGRRERGGAGRAAAAGAGAAGPAPQRSAGGQGMSGRGQAARNERQAAGSWLCFGSGAFLPEAPCCELGRWPVRGYPAEPRPGKQPLLPSGSGRQFPVRKECPKGGSRCLGYCLRCCSIASRVERSTVCCCSLGKLYLLRSNQAKCLCKF